MIAALPMYDRPERAAATDRFWSAIAGGLRARGIDAPDTLTRGADLWDIWQAPDLLLAQTCGLPFRARLAGRVTLVGTPDCGLEGCAPGQYRSVIVARPGLEASDRASQGGALMDGSRLAYNEGLSQSGWAAALDWAGARGLRFGALLPTGSHAASLAAVAEGRADLAALDAATWRLLQRHAPEAGRVTVIDRTAPTPALPLITAAGRDAAPIFAAVAEALDGLDAADRTALGVTGLVRIDAAAYLTMPIPPSPAAYAREIGI